MNQTHGLRVGITICLLLISMISICLGEKLDFSLPGQIDSANESLIDPISENPSDDLPEDLHYAALMGDIHEFHSDEILLVNQSHQIDLNNTISFADREAIEGCISPLSAYESRLRERAIDLAEFEKSLKKCWPKLSLDKRVEMTKYLENMLRDQEIFIYDFQSKLKKKFCSFPIRDRKKFLDSMGDLLDRQANLLLGFEYFLHHLQDVQDGQKMEFLASFEDLIRRQAVLLDIYDAFLSVKCNILKIDKYVDGCRLFKPYQNVTYTYVVKNTCNCIVEDIWIVDSRIGIIIKDISLGPHEEKSFNKSTILNYPCGTRVCNKAQAWGNFTNNFIVMSESNEVCIQMAPPTTKNDTVKLGNQKALAIASDPATAENNIVIKKNQGEKSGPDMDSAGSTTIGVGDQTAASFRGSKGANNINIVSNQQ